jgi:hypothetical protein
MKKTVYGIVFAASAWGLVAHADCTNPTGVEGDVIYNSTIKNLQFCNGTVWVNAAGIAPSAGGGGGGGGALVAYDPNDEVIGYFLSERTSGQAGYNFYNTATRQLVFLTANDISDYSVSVTANVYFSGADCGGSIKGIDVVGSALGYGCTGAATCKTTLKKYLYTNTYSQAYASKRNTSGVCVNGSGSSSMYTMLSSAGTGAGISEICVVGADGVVTSGCYLAAGN